MTREPASGRGKEILIVGLSLAAVMATTLTLGRAWFLLREPAWLDEFHTLLVSSQPDVGTMLRTLERGGDFNPPLLHFFVRALGGLTGGLDPRGNEVFALRLGFMAITWLMLLQVFLILRKRHEILPAFAGAMAVWAHPLTVVHAFELRFYGLWLLCTVFLARADGLPDNSRWRIPLVALAAITVCLVHYFGVLSWGLILLSSWTSVPGLPPRERLRHVVPMLAGPVALAFCVPMYLGQRSTLSVPTWVEATTFRTALEFLFTTPGWLLGIGLAIAWSTSMRWLPRSDVEWPVPRVPAIRNLLSLLLLPLVILVFSVVLQPAMIDRYAIVAIAGVAPVMASAVAGVAPRARPGMVALLLVVGSIGAWMAREDVEERAARRRLTVAAFRDVIPKGALVVSCTRHDLYPLLNASPPLSQRFLLAGIPPGRPDGIRTFHVLEMDVARRQHMLFGYPSILPIEEMRQLADFYVVDHPQAACQREPWLSGYRAVEVARHIFRVTASNSGTPQ